MQYIPHSGRKENNVYQPQRNNIHQLYNITTITTGCRYVVKNKTNFKLNPDVHHTHTPTHPPTHPPTHRGQKCNFHLPSSVLSLQQKGAYSIGVEVHVVNNLPQSTKNLRDDLNDLNQPYRFNYMITPTLQNTLMHTQNDTLSLISCIVPASTVCMYICIMYVCIMYACTCVCTMYVVCIVCTYVCMYLCMYIYMYVFTYYVCTYVCMHVHVYVRRCIKKFPDYFHRPRTDGTT